MAKIQIKSETITLISAETPAIGEDKKLRREESARRVAFFSEKSYLCKDMASGSETHFE